MSEYDWNLSERARITGLPPGSLRREISGLLMTAHVPRMCGLTKIDDRLSEYFVEPVHQVIRDIEMGYTYRLARDGESADLSVLNGELAVAGVPLDLAQVPAADDARPWESWWELCLDDATYYRLRRQQPLVEGGQVFGGLPSN